MAAAPGTGERDGGKRRHRRREHHHIVAVHKPGSRRKHRHRQEPRAPEQRVIDPAFAFLVRPQLLAPKKPVNSCNGGCAERGQQEPEPRPANCLSNRRNTPVAPFSLSPPTPPPAPLLPCCCGGCRGDRLAVLRPAECLLRARQRALPRGRHWPRLTCLLCGLILLPCRGGILLRRRCLVAEQAV